MSNYKSNDNSTENTTLREWWGTVKSEMSRIFGILNGLETIVSITKNEVDDCTDVGLYHVVNGEDEIGGSEYYIFVSEYSAVLGMPEIRQFKIDDKEYTYSGLVKLAGDPYTDMGPEGLVWVFPVRPNQAEGVKKPAGLEFTDMEDFQKRGEQSILHFIRRRDNYIGYRVRHIEHGLGTVNSFDGTLITVSFDNHQTKSYHFNKSISDYLLSVCLSRRYYGTFSRMGYC